MISGLAWTTQFGIEWNHQATHRALTLIGIHFVPEFVIVIVPFCLCRFILRLSLCRGLPLCFLHSSLCSKHISLALVNRARIGTICRLLPFFTFAAFGALLLCFINFIFAFACTFSKGGSILEWKWRCIWGRRCVIMRGQVKIPNHVLTFEFHIH